MDDSDPTYAEDMSQNSDTVSSASQKRRAAYRDKVANETVEQRSLRLANRREQYKNSKAAKVQVSATSLTGNIENQDLFHPTYSQDMSQNSDTVSSASQKRRAKYREKMANETVEQRSLRLAKRREHYKNTNAAKARVSATSLTANIQHQTLEANILQTSFQIRNEPVCTLPFSISEPSQTGNTSNDESDYNQENTSCNYIRGEQVGVAHSSFHTINETNVEEFFCGKIEEQCCHCNSLNFPNERPSDGNFTSCCQKGKVRLAPYRKFPPELENLMNGQDSRHKNFMEHVRSFNSALAFASMGAKTSAPPGYGPYCFKIHGQIYHRIGNAHPEEDQVPKFAQLYFLDTSEAHTHRMEMDENKGCNPNLMLELDQWMRQWNNYARAFMQLREVEHKAVSEAKEKGMKSVPIMMALRHDKGSDPRRYNKPTVNEVAVIFEANEDGEPPLERDILVHLRSDQTSQSSPKPNTKRLSILDPLVDPLTYPLLFPFGDPGWKINIPYNDSTGKRSFVTQAEYYQYRFAIRSQFNPLLNGGKLTQQYAVDSYCRVEANRLQYIRQNQSELRAECYQGLVDEMNSRAERNGLLPGKAIILPSTFQGSPRNMYQNYQDAMSIVGKFGKPDIFLTMTCNPNWKEIKENLEAWQRPENRPDLVARVFNLKLKELISDVTKKGIFGRVIAKIHVIEFQKRGLPHAHMVITLGNEAKPRTREAIDHIVSAEVPDPTKFPRLHSVILKHMIHGPCGEINPSSPCMQDGICTKGYPKNFETCTLENVNGYPMYQRRDTGKSYSVGKNFIDNRWVVPYNPFLSLKYDCHINVEVCASIKSIKYLFKYVYKGYDCAIVELREGESAVNCDEINSFLDARYVSPPEAMWHIFGFHMHQQSHVVVRLPVHLPDQHSVIFHPSQIQTALRASEIKGSKLTAWFKLNESDEEARNLHYWEIPQQYIYEKIDSSQRTNPSQYHWRRRKRGGSNVIGRMYAVNAAQAERFALRLLLLHVKGATSFEDLKTVNGRFCETFFEAAKEMGLIMDDDVWDKTLRDAENAGMPKQLRQLFAFICVYGTTIDTKKLWLEHKEYMIEDFRNHQGHQENCSACEQMALHDINETLLTNGLSCSAVGLPAAPSNIPLERTTAMEILQDREEGEKLVQSLSTEQKLVFDNIMESINNEQPYPKCFFLDGPGGSGKTYLYKTLLTVLRGNQSSALPVASTGIAADLLKNGCTAHSQFKLPIPLLDGSVSDIRPNSQQGKSLRNADLIIWDEATMTLGPALKVVDRLCQEVMKNSIPFGGKVFLLGGDFRQTLPVVPRGHRSVIIQSSIKKSKLWKHFKPLTLKVSQRCNDLEYNHWLDKLGKGTLSNSEGLDEDIIEVPEQFVCDGDLITEIFEGKLNISNFAKDCANRAILCPTNQNVDHMNEKVLSRFEGQETTYLSVDSVDATSFDHIQNLPVEFLNTLTPSGVPSHKLSLKKGTVIMCLRNMDRKRGLLNGTKLVVKDLKAHVILSEILTGSAKGQQVLLPRIDFATRDHPDIPFILRRRQFPVKLSSAITINKSQGQTLDKVGIFLPDPVFSHGQLYTAFSRVKRASDVKIKIIDGPSQGKLLKNSQKVFTRNVVFKEIFDK